MKLLRRLFQKPRWESQLDAELRYDFDRTAANYMAQGLNEAEARRRARLDFGGLEQVKEKCRDARGTRWLETTLQDVRFACRQLLVNPAFTTVAVLALALGIGANTAVFTVVDGVLLRALPFPEPERLLLISHIPLDFPFHLGPSLTEGDYLRFHEQDKLFERMATFDTSQVNVTGGGEPVRASCAKVTLEFFAALGVHAAAGRTFLAGEDQPGRDRVAVLSDALWHSRFGVDTYVPGKTITVDGITYSVIGRMPAGFNFPVGMELWMPQAIHIDPHNARMRPVVGRLRPGASARQALAELEGVLAHSWDSTAGEEKIKFSTQVVPLKEMVVGDVREMLVIFAGAVAFVLLIACANVANLLLIRASARQREIAVRSALGASRWRLIRQMLTESTLVSLCGGALGLLLATWGAPALVKLAPEGTIPRVDEIHFDSWVLAFTFAVSALNGVVFGLAPALRATRRPLRESIGGGHGFTRHGFARHGFARHGFARHDPLRSALVVAEIALALMLLTGAGLMIKSFARIRAADPGFRAGNVVTMTVELPDSVYRTAAQMQQFHTRLLTRLANLPGAQTAASINALPLNEGLTMGDFTARGREMPKDYLVDKLNVSPGYFRTMGIRFESGRDFAATDGATAPGVVIVSQSVARAIWPGEDAVGKVLAMEDNPKPADWLTVVGVVDEVKQQGLTRKPDAALYQPYQQVYRTGWLSHMVFVVRTSADSETVAKSMRTALQEVDSQQPAEEIATMADLIDGMTAQPLFQARLLGGFSLLALVLAAIGIYGVLAYSVTERTREIGIRMALGAGRAEVLGMVLRRAVALAAAGVALGAAGALAVTRVLGELLFEVKPNDPGTFVAVAALLAAVAVASAIVPARRAAGVDPIITLRCE